MTIDTILRRISIAAVLAAAPLLATAPTTAQMGTTEAKCTAQWSKLDTSGDGRVSKAEVEASLDRSFNEIDLDRDGKISEAEYRACHKFSALYATDGIEPGNVLPEGSASRGGTSDPARQQPPAGRSEPRAPIATNAGAPGGPGVPGDRKSWLEAADTDKDKSVSRTEAARAGQKIYSLQPNREARSEAGSAQQSASNFAHLDANRDGKVDEAEAARTPQQGVAMAADADRDGTISKEEWREHRRQGHTRAQAAAEQDGEAAAGSDPSLWYYYVFAI